MSAIGFRILALTILVTVTTAITSMAQKPLTGLEVATNYQKAFFYPGQDMKALVFMRLIESGGKERARELTMLRKNMDNSQDQKYFIYFLRPADVQGLTFLVYKYPQKDDDRWLFMPALDLVKRIAANDKRSSFVGSDFTYEDISGRDLSEDDLFFEKEHRMENVKNKHQTLVIYNQVECNLDIEPDLFSERFLKRPPTKWINR